LSPALRYVIAFWLLWAVLVTLTAGESPHSENIAVASGLGTVVLPIIAYLWCKADSAARAVNPPPGAIPLLAVLVPIGWLYYLFATRSPLRAASVVISTLVGAFGLGGIAAFVKAGAPIAN